MSGTEENTGRQANRLLRSPRPRQKGSPARVRKGKGPAHRAVQALFILAARLLRGKFYWAGVHGNHPEDRPAHVDVRAGFEITGDGKGFALARPKQIRGQPVGRVRQEDVGFEGLPFPPRSPPLPSAGVPFISAARRCSSASSARNSGGASTSTRLP